MCICHSANIDSLVFRTFLFKRKMPNAIRWATMSGTGFSDLSQISNVKCIKFVIRSGRGMGAKFTTRIPMTILGVDKRMKLVF